MLQKGFLLFLSYLTVCSGEFERQIVLKKEGSTLKRRGDVFENYFNVYDPSFLSAVWPKISNGVHLMLEMSCWDDMTVFFRDLGEGRAWAYDAVDSSGRYQSALFVGSKFWLGSKQECLRLDESSKQKVDKDTLIILRNNDYLHTVFRRQKYFDAEINDWRWPNQPDEVMQRLSAADHTAPYRMAYTVVQIRLNITKVTMIKSYEITLGVCLPKSCPQDDVESIINFSVMLNDNLKSNKTIQRIAKVVSSRKLDEDFQIGNDMGAIALIVVTVILVSLAVVATIVDFDLLRCVSYKKHSMSFDLPTTNNSETMLVDELKRKHKDMKSVDDIPAENTNLNTQLDKIPRSITSPSINLDVLHSDRLSGSCQRCGKYKKQCPNSKHVDTVSACPRMKYSSFASLSTDRRKNSLFCRLLLCFSLRYSWKRIFNKHTANKDLWMIHFIRIAATLWVIFIHVSVIAGYTSETAGDINDRDNLYYIISTGTIAFDTLFFVSGLFSSHHFFYLKSRYSVEELVSFSGSCGQFMQFVCFVTNRIIRLLPSYAYAVLLSGVTARMLRGSSALPSPDDDHYNCYHYWWRNVLYVTTVYPHHEQCMQISWYLTTETQLHAVGALVCAASVSASMSASLLASMRPKLVVAIAAALTLASAASDIGASYFEDEIRFADVKSAYWLTLVRPCGRVAPYFAGVLTGWLALHMHQRVKLTKTTWALLWAAGAPPLCLSAYVSRGAAREGAAWLQLAAPAALLGPALASTATRARVRCTISSGCAALSRLSAAMLVAHAAAARLLLVGDVALCSHTSCIWMYFAGTTVLTIGIALLLSLLIEMPCCGLFRRLSDCATT